MLNHIALIMVLENIAESIENLSSDVSVGYVNIAIDLRYEAEALRSLVCDLQHQKDVLDTQRADIKALSEARRTQH